MCAIVGNHYQLAGYKVELSKHGTLRRVFAVFAEKSLDPENLPKEGSLTDALLKKDVRLLQFTLSSEEMMQCLLTPKAILGTASMPDGPTRPRVPLAFADMGEKKFSRILNQMTRLDLSALPTTIDDSNDGRFYIPASKAALK